MEILQNGKTISWIINLTVGLEKISPLLVSFLQRIVKIIDIFKMASAVRLTAIVLVLLVPMHNTEEALQTSVYKIVKPGQNITGKNKNTI